MSLLWGPDKNLDYWKASRLGVVSPEERRAVALLASISDEGRFSFYCLSGQFPAMGNVTKRIYLIRRWTTVLELEDGQERASWCINTDDRLNVPPTDHVVVMKNLIEGSELAFREIGNEALQYKRPEQVKGAGRLNPYYGSLGPEPAFNPSPGWNTKAGIMEETRRLRKWAFDRAEHYESRWLHWRHRLTRLAFVSRAKRWVCLPEKPRRVSLDEGTYQMLASNYNQRAITSACSTNTGWLTSSAVNACTAQFDIA